MLNAFEILRSNLQPSIIHLLQKSGFSHSVFDDDLRFVYQRPTYKGTTPIPTNVVVTSLMSANWVPFALGQVWISESLVVPSDGIRDGPRG